MKIESNSLKLNRVVRAFVAAASFSSLAFAMGSAAASPEYPAALAKAAGMSCIPGCPVCHTTNPGQSGTAVQKFAVAMRSKGLLAGNPSLVAEAFNKLEDPVQDTGQPNPSYVAMVDALKQNYDPNYDISLGQLACGPTYGCGARIAKAPPQRSDAFAWVLGIAVLGATVRVVRRKA